MFKVSNASIPALSIYKYISAQALPEDDVAYRGTPILQLSATTGQDLSLHDSSTEKQLHTNEEHAQPNHRSFEAAEGPQMVNMGDLAEDDIAIVCVIKSYSGACNLIFSSVVGPPGSGKSTVNQTTKSGVC